MFLVDVWELVGSIEVWEGSVLFTTWMKYSSQCAGGDKRPNKAYSVVLWSIVNFLFFFVFR